MKKRQAIIVGAGIGGLVAAIELAAKGLDVRVFEKSAYPGGKLRTVEIDGRLIDSGPTVLTMPWIFEEIFATAGSCLNEHVQLVPSDILARHAWQDGSRLDLFADIDQSAQAITDFADASEARRYRMFCERARKVYSTLEHSFMFSQRPGVATLIKASGLSGLMDLWRIHPFQSLWRALGQSFRDQRLRGLFARYATYCGSSPLLAPATLMLIAHVEQRGVWQITGGMRQLANALTELLLSHGGQIHYDTSVDSIQLSDGQVQGVALASGDDVACDILIANTDVRAMVAGQLGASARSAVAIKPTAQRSLSAVTWSMMARTSGFELAHHNVFFPHDYPREFEEIFKHKRLPARPAVYICAQDRGGSVTLDPDVAQEEPERLFLITNAPATGESDNFGPAAIEPLEAATMGLLQDCGLHLNIRADQKVLTTPTDFEALVPGTGGALYGTPAHGWQASFRRPGSRSKVRGLYLAGGSVHPGPGLPMVATSGQLAAAAVLADLGLTGPA